jgi:hypothetical protein
MGRVEGTSKSRGQPRPIGRQWMALASAEDLERL